MIIYKDYEKKVFDWLMSKNKEDDSFTFSVRQKANNGAAKDYFIGTEKSNYFGMTFWTISVSYPGSSVDCMDLFFFYTSTGYNYYFEVTQTTTPEGDQNISVLNLLKSLKNELSEFPGFQRENSDKTRMFGFRTKTNKASYDNLDEMFLDVEKDIDYIIPLVDKLIELEKQNNPNFKAHRITKEEFKKMISKLSNRLERNDKNEMEEELEEEIEVLNSFAEKNTPLNQILYGPPGTGKTYNTINKAISIIEGKTKNEIENISRKDLKKKFDDYLIKDWKEPKGQIGFVTFHQSMSYEDFVEGIKPKVNSKQDVTYDIIHGIFRNICSLANDNWLDAKKNSGLLAFEEAYNFLKDDWEDDPEMKFPMKTKGKDFTILGFTDLSIQFKKSSGGTGHTLSKSTLRDYYYETREVGQTGVGIYYPPILEKLKKYKPSSSSKTIKKVENQFVLIIDEINRGNISQIFGELITLIEEGKRLGKDESLEITLPYSKDVFGVPPNLHIIGTMNTADRSVEALDTALRRRFSFVEMMPDLEVVEKENFNDFDRVSIMRRINQRVEVLLDRNYTLGHSYFIKEDFRNSFENEIIPLLQEYFYNDYGKIGLVLGRGFVQEKEITKKRNELFADFDTINEVDIVKSYEMIPFNVIDFDSAIQTLLA